MTESEIRAATKRRVKGWLRSRGYPQVILDFSDKRRMPSGLKYAPDWIFFLPDTTVMVEFKTESGQRSEGQLEFWLTIFGFLGRHLRYVLATSPEHVMDELMLWEKERRNDEREGQNVASQ